MVDRLVQHRRIVRGDQRLAEHHLDQPRLRRQGDGLAERSDALADLAALHQELTLELIEVRIVRLLGDQSVEILGGPLRAR